MIAHAHRATLFLTLAAAAIAGCGSSSGSQSDAGGGGGSEAGSPYDAALEDGGSDSSASSDGAGPGDVATDGNLGEAGSLQGIVPPDRMIDWSRSGVIQPDGTRGIPNRTTVCATIDAATYGNGTTDAAGAIQSAIDTCPDNQVVYLPAGTYKLGSAVSVDHPVVLRGAGAAATKIVESAHIAFDPVRGGSWPSQLYTVDWTAGYAKGTSSITLADTSDLKVGQDIVLDQLNDTSVVSPIGNEGTCGIGVNDCISPGNGPTFCTDGTYAEPRALTQLVTITALSGNTVTIDPPLYYTHQASLTPQAFFWAGGNLKYAGIEDIKIDAQYGDAAVAMSFCTDCWAKGIEVDHIARGAVTFFYALHAEVRDSYFFMNQATAPTNYGLEVDETSASLFENNILDTLTAGILLSWSSNGNVVAYNFGVNGGPGSQIAVAESGTHSVHTYMNLWESNSVTRLNFDVIWGSGSHETLFRNRMTGYKAPSPSAGGGALWSNGNWPLVLEAWQRFFNVVGNVLGTAGVQNAYQAADVASGNLINTTGHSSSCMCCSCGMGVGPAYILGYWNTWSSTANTAQFDPLVASTLLRWGNFDYFTNMTHWDPKEIPTGAATPTTQTLPASLYLRSKPSWFGSAAWPAIGPDVSGMATPLPAELCYKKEIATGGAFDPSQCY